MYQVTDKEGLPVTMNVEQVAAFLGISRVGAYNLVRIKGFPSMRIGKRILIPRDQFLSWLEKLSSTSDE